MGEIADMILDGILDEETGEYIGDINEEIYGDAAPGFPVSHNRETNAMTKDGNPIYRPHKMNCPICNKLVKKRGLKDHLRVVHEDQIIGTAWEGE